MLKKCITKKMIDLRSDTVTLPTEEMLEAIRVANFGDDVFGEDPTVNKLEDVASEKMGKEAAMIVPSGTMANLVSVKTNTKRGDSVILEANSHIYWHELGGISSIAGVLPLPVRGKMGVLSPESVEENIRVKGKYSTGTELVCIEDTHNRAGGTIVKPSEIKALSEITKNYGVNLYMDGARMLNAAVALRADVKEFTKHVDNLMFCLSKGLSCPAGSIVVGTEEFIQKARRVRKILGGGMRQAGIIAAPGIVALEKMIDRLEEDHKNARFLAEGLINIEGIRVNLETVQTNMVICDVKDLGVEALLFVERLKKQGVLTLTLDKNRIRLVTHRGIVREDLKNALVKIEQVSQNLISRI